MEILWSVLIGYALGCISPSAIISKLKRRNLRQEGTGNLGATNVTMVFGKGWGVFVMLFDIAKGAAAYLICDLAFRDAILHAGLIAGLCAMLGHVFPFYLGFKGGKGLATFGGVALAYNPLLFLILIVSCMVIMLIVNYSYVFPYVGASLFCIGASLWSLDIYVFLLTLPMAALIIYKHFGNLKKARSAEDITVRDYIKKHIFGKKSEKAE
ncbi:MAG: glycerol-3-phosphate acyltransferase [Clostridia bacterium]|nr:glycerol-3-phosphate acyltransferase [Clostridia bacterium]